jgi:Zn-finger nucleic acid-binding protein
MITSSISWKTEEGKTIKTPCTHDKIPGLDTDFCETCRIYWVDNYEIKQFKERKKAQGMGSIEQTK